MVKNNYYFVELKLRGVGFKSVVIKNNFFLKIGYSHYIFFKIPNEVFVFSKKDRVLIFSISKQKLFEFANSVVKIKSPDAYKFKGISYASQPVKTKIGKQRL